MIFGVVGIASQLLVLPLQDLIIGLLHLELFLLLPLGQGNPFPLPPQLVHQHHHYCGHTQGHADHQHHRASGHGHRLLGYAFGQPYHPRQHSGRTQIHRHRKLGPPLIACHQIGNHQGSQFKEQTGERRLCHIQRLKKIPMILEHKFTGNHRRQHTQDGEDPCVSHHLPGRKAEGQPAHGKTDDKKGAHTRSFPYRQPHMGQFRHQRGLYHQHRKAQQQQLPFGYPRLCQPRKEQIYDHQFQQGHHRRGGEVPLSKQFNHSYRLLK